MCIKRKKKILLIDGITGRPTLPHAGFQSRQAEMKRGYACQNKINNKNLHSFFISRDYYKSLSTFAPMQIFPREKLIGFRVFLLITSIIIIQWIKFSSVKRSNEMWMGSIVYPCTRRDHAKTSSDLMLVEYSLFRETGNIRIVNFNNVSIPLGYTPHVRAHVANWSRTPELIMPRCHCTRFA